MFNSKLKLQGLSLEAIIHEGVHGFISNLSIDDWVYVESLAKNYLTPDQVDNMVKEELDETADCNYSQGLADVRGEYYYENKRLKDLLEENNIEY